MSRTIRFALLVLVVVVVALAIYTYPSPAGVLTLVFRAVVLVGALTILAVLIASLFGRKPAGFSIVLLLAAAAVVVFSWPQVAATADARQLKKEIAAVDGDAPRAIANSTTRSAGFLRGFLAIADTAAREAQAEITGFADPAAVRLEDLFTTAALADPAAVAAARAAIAPAIEAARAMPAEIGRLLDAEKAAIEAFDTSGLPDSARLVLVSTAVERVEAERSLYLTLAGLELSRLMVRERMLAFLEARPGAYVFDDTTRGPRFTDPVDQTAWTALVAELTGIDAEDTRLRAALTAIADAAPAELVEAIATTP